MRQETFSLNVETLYFNQKALEALLDWGDSAHYSEFLLSMQEHFLFGIQADAIDENGKVKPDSGFVNDYTREAVFDFKNLIIFINTIKDARLFSEQKVINETAEKDNYSKDILNALFQIEN